MKDLLQKFENIKNQIFIKTKRIKLDNIELLGQPHYIK